MGSAPRTGKPPSMPDPVRLVKRSIRHVVYCGYTDLEARRFILTAVRACRDWVGSWDNGLAEWLDAVEKAAWHPVLVPVPPDTTSQEAGHGGETTAGGEACEDPGAG